MTRWLRTLLPSLLALAVAGAPLAALAQGGGKELKGVLEKVDVPASRILVRESHGRKHEMPLNVTAETEIVTPSGAASLAALHVGDHVTVRHGPGPKGDTARQIRVTEPAETH